MILPRAFTHLNLALGAVTGLDSDGPNETCSFLGPNLPQEKGNSGGASAMRHFVKSL